MFHILACQQLNPDQNGQKHFVIFFLTFPFPFLYLLAATGKIWGGLKALAAKPKAEEVSYLDNCPQTDSCYSLAMDYCPFKILFGGNTPLQGFGDTRGDPSST